MVSARTLSGRIQVSLVERASALGGQALNLYRTWKGDDIQKNLSDLCGPLRPIPTFEVHLNTELTNVEGFVGNFKTTISKGANPQVVEHGIAVLSTGAKEFNRMNTSTERLQGNDPSGTGQEVSESGPGSEGDKERGVYPVRRVAGAPQALLFQGVLHHSIESALQLKEMNPT